MLSLANKLWKKRVLSVSWWLFFFTQGPCCKGNCSQILASQRGTILSCMTEGRLNHILDILRSQQMLSRIDYETIISYPTVTSRARALLDICLCLGEKAAQVVVTVLTVNKCSPLARGSHCIGWPETNRLLLWHNFEVCYMVQSTGNLEWQWFTFIPHKPLKSVLYPTHDCNPLMEKKTTWMKRSHQPAACRN